MADNSLSVFLFESQEIRFVDDKPVAIDVAKTLGYASPKDAVRDLISEKYLTYGELPTIRYGENKERIEKVKLISNEAGIYQLIFKSKLETAEKFQDWVFTEVLPSIRKTGSYSIQPQPAIKQPLSLPEVANSIEKISASIEYFSSSGDLQLAQLLKSTLGNMILAEQQSLLSPVVEQYEGAVDVAIRLGYSVPSNFEGALGNFVRKICGHLLTGKNKRYSTASHKQVSANMYPAHNKLVEQTVTEYCLQKAFRNKNLN